MANILDLPPRYEVRRLELEHLSWVSAIVTHSNLFHSPVWVAIYPEEQARRAYALHRDANYLLTHQIESGHSLGIFDKEYQFKREESAATGGKLYWDESDEAADGAKLLEQMDFPLVSVAMAYDSFYPLDMEKMQGMLSILPAFAHLHGGLIARDQRDGASWEAKAPGEVLFRAATSTRHDYEGKGIMKAQAHYMMRQAAAGGFRGIQIECMADAVTHVWGRPPAPFRGSVVAEFASFEYEYEDEAGIKLYPFRPATQQISKVYCTLKD